MSYAIVIGDPIDGIEIIGPFPDHDTAQSYVDLHMKGSDNWWIVLLQEPAK